MGKILSNLTSWKDSLSDKISPVYLFPWILIVICLVVGNRKNSNAEIDLSNGNTEIESAYNEIIDEVTGEKKYVVYNKNTGEEIVTLNEDQEHLLPIYEMDPTYEELPVETPEMEIENMDIIE